MAEYTNFDDTKIDGFDLTAGEQRLLEVLLNPEHTGKTIAEKCRIAGISRAMYYRYMQNPKFLQALNKTALMLIRDKVADVLNATYKFALQPKGHQDRKLLLELFDMYAAKAKVEVSGENGEPIQVATLSEEEKRELLKNIAKRIAKEDGDNPNLQNSS